MSPELKVELKRLRHTRFYYLSSRIPSQVWRDREKGLHYMGQMELSHLQACISLIKKDISFLSQPQISSEAAKKLEKQAKVKLEELKAVFKSRTTE